MPPGSSQADRKGIVPILGNSYSDEGDTAPAELPVPWRSYGRSSWGSAKLSDHRLFINTNIIHDRALTALPEEGSMSPGAHSIATALPHSLWQGQYTHYWFSYSRRDPGLGLGHSTAIAGWGEGGGGLL